MPPLFAVIPYQAAGIVKPLGIIALVRANKTALPVAVEVAVDFFTGKEWTAAVREEEKPLWHALM